ncbi:histidinol-phosphate phosphatase family protein/HAD superfamily hydrolase (TIGR01662 family) [Motilibacter peucedani]|uniref:D,D-heptose 1,7-bisphosphate phosphatase n=1 Tax=Motilibacter peucedani TaxID=598650 RepID=A0A420XU86_9ACTN|nr:HAD-IIIA family hydrolase [Motilibacter peucedani]RKS80219.1 histidinol-phosphate phosphatase family protein/HAD superfamily hydrolase (TIGR01662 family) [Motilibacter peucedani]
MRAAAGWSVVVPTVGRPSLEVLLDSLAAQPHRPAQVVVVDDRREPLTALALPEGVEVVRSGGRGPAAARNLGWRRTLTPWVVFVDDDVVLPAGWSDALVADLVEADPALGGSQARLRVPLPGGRRPTDWERGTAGLEAARWATAEMAYRRAALEAVGGFDERFPRAFREDADLAARVRRAGWTLARGSREAVHPVRPASRLASLRQQRGNADDVLMRKLHGPRWMADTECPPGRLPWHVATVAAAAGAVGALALRRPRTSAVLTAGWLALTADFAARRIVPGPRTRDEVEEMVLTSVLIPFAAVGHRLAGEWRHRDAEPKPVPAPAAQAETAAPAVRAVLFDRDGTLIHDVPYNGDPARVRPVDDASEAVARLRSSGVALGVVTNQSGIARGLLTRDQVDAVNGRVDALLGPFDTWQVCPHGPEDGCACRKPGPGMVLAAADALGVEPAAIAVIGDIGADVGAAEAAGATGILVPTPATRADEVDAAARRAGSLTEALDLLGVPR